MTHKLRRPGSSSYIYMISLLFICTSLVKAQVKEIGQVLAILSHSKDSIEITNGLNRLGVLYRTRNADSCFFYGVEAKRIATHIRYRIGQIEADHVIAFALFKKGLYAESLELLSKVLPHYKRLNDIEKTVRIYMDMAEVGNKGIFDRKKITSLLQHAIHTGKNLQKDSIMAEVYIYYCNRNTSLSEDSIRHYLGRSKEIANRYNDESMQIYNQLWQVRLLAIKGKNEEALSLAKQSLTAARFIGNATLEINSLIAIGNHYSDNPKKQLGYLNQQYEVARRSGDKYLEIYILNAALAVANDLGDKENIIKAHIALKTALLAEWEKSKKFMGDYVRYNAIEDHNKLLSKENEQRTLWLVVISALATITILAVYVTMLRRSRKAKEQIETLNNAANIQIIALEEAKQLAVREEQQRLGQDLHDGLSASIAAIKHQLEILAMDTDHNILQDKLAILQSELAKAYEVARAKSHQWFDAVEGQEEQSFELRIKQLSARALPDSRYQKEIHIDDGALRHVPMDTRIALLRIIQEAITNIIKHAKAKKICILIYEEKGSLELAISDDGKGFEKEKLTDTKSAMGLQSIRRRIRYLNGQMIIKSDKQGTEISVSFPLSPTPL